MTSAFYGVVHLLGNFRSHIKEDQLAKYFSANLSNIKSHVILHALHATISSLLLYGFHNVKQFIYIFAILKRFQGFAET